MRYAAAALLCVTLAACAAPGNGPPAGNAGPQPEAAGQPAPAPPPPEPPSPAPSPPAISNPTGAARVCRAIGQAGSGADAGAYYATSDNLVTFVSNLDVNTDGALESYKSDDLGHFANGRLNTHSALNTICNGAKIRRMTGSRPSSSDPTVFGPRQCQQLIARFEDIRANDWRPVDGHYVDLYAIATKPDGRTPCQKDAYYVSQVARPLGNGDRCDPATWLDSLAMPAIVIPSSSAMRDAGVRQHDLAAVRIPGSNTWIGAVVGDTGGSTLGEGTVRLAMMLRGLATRPANYREVVGLAVPRAEYVIFPGTGRLVAPLTNGSAAPVAREAARLVASSNLGSRQICP